MTTNYIDPNRSACLCDAGNPDYLAAVVIGPEGQQHLLLARCDAIVDEDVRYDPTCAAVSHEQTGALPLEFVRRITISRRTNCCGRRTKSGAPCRTPVARPGDTCVWHREQAALDLLADQLGAKPIDPERGTTDE